MTPKVGDWARSSGRVGYWRVTDYDPEAQRGHMTPESSPMVLDFYRNPEGSWRVGASTEVEIVTWHPDYVPEALRGPIEELRKRSRQAKRDGMPASATAYVEAAFLLVAGVWRWDAPEKFSAYYEALMEETDG